MQPDVHNLPDRYEGRDNMEHTNKGIFITTSSFTDDAVSYIEKQQQKSIKLIDGQLLSELLGAV